MRHIAFVISFALMGCGIDSAFDSMGAFVVWIIATIVFVGTTLSIIKE